MFYNENFSYLLCFCVNPIFGKNFVPKVIAKMFSANQIAGFLNQPVFQNKETKQPNVLIQIHKNQKMIKNFFGMVKNGHGQPGLWTLKLIVSQQ